MVRPWGEAKATSASRPSRLTRAGSGRGFSPGPLLCAAASRRRVERRRTEVQIPRPRRKRAARVHDALIASVAVANDLPLYTVNPEDFAGIDELTLVAVPLPDLA